MQPDIDLATAGRASLELSITKATALPPGEALTAYLSAIHQRLSMLCEQAGDFEAALHHYRRFHQLSLQEQGTALLDRAAFLQGLSEIAGPGPAA